MTAPSTRTVEAQTLTGRYTSTPILLTFQLAKHAGDSSSLQYHEAHFDHHMYRSLIVDSVLWSCSLGSMRCEATSVQIVANQSSATGPFAMIRLPTS